MSKFLFLGASWGQINPIKRAAQLHDVYTLDNEPTNPGHKFSKKSFNLSTDNFHEIMKLVNKYKFDAVYCFASDVGQITQSKISKNIGQHYNPVSSIETLIDKHLFRDLLNKEKIQTQFYLKIRSNDLDENNTISMILNNLPVVSKPLKGSGSKGVSFIKSKKDLYKIKASFNFSEEIIIESFFQKEGRQICGDGYFENGKLVYFITGDGYFHDNEDCQVPYAESFPSSHGSKVLNEAKLKVELILQKSGFQKGFINFDIIIVDGSPFIIEIAPRSGGNFIPDVIYKHCGIDLIGMNMNVYSSKNFSPNEEYKMNAFTSSYMIHSLFDGFLKKIDINKELEQYIYSKVFFIQQGDYVDKFTQGSNALGNIQLCFPSKSIQDEVMLKINSLVKVILS